jgi:hypothetical protein
MKRRRFIHYSLKQKKGKAKNGAVLNNTIAFLLPLDAQGRGRRILFSLALPVPSFSETTKKMPTQSPHLPKALTGGLPQMKKQKG